MGVMLSQIIQNWIDKRTLKKLLQLPIYQIAFATLRADINDGTKGLGKHTSEGFRQKICARILKDVESVTFAKDPVLANREKLAEAVLGMTKYQVIILPAEKDNEEEVTGLRGRPGISGELKTHLLELSKSDQELKELAYDLDNPSNEDIYEICLLRYWIYGLSVNVFNTVRIFLDDYHKDKEKDWLRPFIEAMCAWQEHHYREKTGLPDILSEQSGLGYIAAIHYSVFMNIVISGKKHPFMEWQNLRTTYSSTDSS